MRIGTLVVIDDINRCEEVFQTVRKMGIRLGQLKYKPKRFTDEAAHRIQAASEAFGVELHSIFSGFGDNEVRWDPYYGHRTVGIGIAAYQAQRLRYIKETADFAHKIGITELLLHAGFVPNDPLSEEYANIKTGVELLSGYLKTLGMDLLLETGCEAPMVLRGLIEDVGRDNVFINFDPANILMYGYGNPNDALRVFGQYVRNIHGKDGCLPEVPFTLGKERAMGEGMVDFPQIFRQLKELGYDDCVIIEREISGEAQKRDILRAKAYMEEIFANIGVNCQ